MAAMSRRLPQAEQKELLRRTAAIGRREGRPQPTQFTVTSAGGIYIFPFRGSIRRSTRGHLAASTAPNVRTPTRQKAPALRQFSARLGAIANSGEGDCLFYLTPIIARCRLRRDLT